MRIETQFPHPIREIENLFIPLSDGCRLAARLWMPEDAEQNPVPAILEYLPYRKRDGTAERDALTHPWFAGHGYASVRVDLRGSGESDGLLRDEYLKQEQDDALEVIEWLAKQPWCDGQVGMMGISWGGFNGLQVAARRPPSLKAIVTLCSTDDRWADDIHYKGGCLLLENLGWATTMFSYMAAIPDPLLVGDRWREMWLERLDQMPLLIEEWLRHQERDEYWQHGSLCEDYSAIEAAVYAIGGWGDAYSNAVGRMMEHLKCPKKALIGPWAHKYPHFAVPQPAIDFLQEALRWWDHWLKGIDTGILDEPPCTFYLQDAVPPRTSYEERPGVWVREPSWPSPNVTARSFHLSPGELREEACEPASVEVDSPLTTGRASGEYCAIWLGPDFPGDQRVDDFVSVCFDSVPLEEPLDLLGAPALELEVSSDSDCGQLVVRLNDVAPNGEVTRITYGVSNLTMRERADAPRLLVPGERYEIRVQLDDVGYRVPAGHRLRLAISSAYFPLLWPAPKKAALTLALGSARLQLPIREGEVLAESPFSEPEGARPLRQTELRAAGHRRQVTEDSADGRVTTTIEDDFGRWRLDDHGFEIGERCREEYSVLPQDPLSASADLEWEYEAGRQEVAVRVVSRCRMSGSETELLLEAEQIAWEAGEEVHRRVWRRRVPRRWI